MIKHGGRHMECAYYDEPSPIGGQSTMLPSLRSTVIDNPPRLLARAHISANISVYQRFSKPDR
ncbi:MAG: hypothetical protein ACKOOI_14000 [Pirellula sp.]